MKDKYKKRDPPCTKSASVSSVTTRSKKEVFQPHLLDGVHFVPRLQVKDLILD